MENKTERKKEKKKERKIERKNGKKMLKLHTLFNKILNYFKSDNQLQKLEEEQTLVLLLSSFRIPPKHFLPANTSKSHQQSWHHCIHRKTELHHL